jgi:hypothetical protein
VIDSEIDANHPDLAEIMHHEARFFVRLLRRRAAAIRPAGSV